MTQKEFESRAISLLKEIVNLYMDYTKGTKDYITMGLCDGNIHINNLSLSEDKDYPVDISIPYINEKEYK